MADGGADAVTWATKGKQRRSDRLASHYDTLRPSNVLHEPGELSNLQRWRVDHERARFFAVRKGYDQTEPRVCEICGEKAIYQRINTQKKRREGFCRMHKREAVA